MEIFKDKMKWIRSNVDGVAQIQKVEVSRAKQKRRIASNENPINAGHETTKNPFGIDRFSRLRYCYVKDATKIPKEYLVSASGVCFALLLVVGLGVGNLTNLLGFGYPSIKSFQAIEAKHKGDDIQWLVYWVIFSIFAMAETFLSFLMYWIPFYHAFKLASLLWLMLPQTKGAKFLYEAVLKDFLKKSESKIDAALADAKKNAGAIASDAAKAGGDLVNGDSKKET